MKHDDIAELLPYEPEFYRGPSHWKATQLSAHLTLLIQDLLPLPAELETLAKDVTATVRDNALSVPFEELAVETFRAIPGDSVPVALGVLDVTAAAQRLCAYALSQKVELPDALKKGPLAVLPDDQAMLIRDLPLRDLRPDFSDMQLATWLEQAPSEAEQLTILALWWLRSRSKVMDMPIGPLLELAAQGLSIAEDIRREQGLSLERCRDIRQALMSVRMELPDLRIQALMRPYVLRHELRPKVTQNLHAAIIDFYQAAQGEVTANRHSIDATLWFMFDEFDRLVQQAHQPEEEHEFKLLLKFTALYALFHTRRAPGMGLPLTVEVAAHLSGLDPLWNWQMTQKPGEQIEALNNAFLMVMRSMHLYQFYRDTANEPRVRRYVAQAGGHLFALCRRMNLRLPEEGALMELIQADNPGLGRASVLTRQELLALDAQLTELFTPLKTAAPRQEEQLQEAAPETVSEVPVVLTPLHVQEARELLKGRTVTLLGGIPSPERKEALEQALGVSLDWIAADEYQHGAHAGSRIRPDTALVVLAVRWMGHAHNGLRDVAREKGVPVVMHPGGLSPSSVAYQILQQVSRQLGAA